MGRVRKVRGATIACGAKHYYRGGERGSSTWTQALGVNYPVWETTTGPAAVETGLWTSFG